MARKKDIDKSFVCPNCGGEMEVGTYENYRFCPKCEEEFILRPDGTPEPEEDESRIERYANIMQPDNPNTLDELDD